jgi:hypothetical protein
LTPLILNELARLSAYSCMSRTRKQGELLRRGFGTDNNRLTNSYAHHASHCDANRAENGRIAIVIDGVERKIQDVKECDHNEVAVSGELGLS